MSAGSASGATAGTGGAPLLRVRGLDVALPPGADREHAIRGLDLELSANEILCVVGESGSGKSMTASALMRLLPTGVKVVAGGIEFDGRDLLALDEAQMREVRGAQIAMVFQEPMTALNPLRTVGDQIGEMFRIHT
ncbi:MAG: ATP-binding cassette domain-containing protein, partial [Gammaproteobacteria bacterium]